MRAHRFTPNTGGELFAALMATPADAPRPLARELVPLGPEALSRRAHRFLTLATVYNERARIAKARAENASPYRQWLASFMSASDIAKLLAKEAA